ncbi:DUF732 domain-containing protein [uncultured Gordonia sp.]|uniref:DUF732 domain-containing protein n=1 Tax=uncultured Gordonia sp. TaxID=198437 RepID=UPI00258F895F|nr:DUF732 domain-containing protein [uncultured Gordonia sp.]
MKLKAVATLVTLVGVACVVVALVFSFSEDSPRAVIQGASTTAPLTPEDLRFLSMIDDSPGLIGNQETQIRAGRNVCYELRHHGTSSTLTWLTDEVGLPFNSAVDIMYAAETAYCP